MESKREHLCKIIDQLPDERLRDAESLLTKLTINDPPQYLYHYTSQRALLSILKDKKLWITNYRYLNDYKELLEAVELFKTEIKFKKPELGKSLNFIGENFFNIAVFSLSSEKDSLSQWRSYGDYAIVFDRDKLNSLLEKREFTKLNHCIYDKDKQIEMIDKFTRQMLEEREKRQATIDSNSPYEINIQCFIQKVGLLIKHSGFREEHEWRTVSKIVSSQFNSDHLKKGFECKTREGNNHLVPHFEVDLRDEEGNLPIHHIMVGPCRDQELAVKAAKELISILKVDCKVEKSDIPYRG